MKIRDLRPGDWAEVAGIYAAGVRTRNGTFETAVPVWDEWDARHLARPRLVAVEAGAIVGWAALSPVSARECYAGVAEDSVYVAPGRQGRGVGRALLEELVARSETEGLWTLQTSIFPENPASLGLRERVETVIDAVEEATGHVGVTVVEAVGHGRERGITHEYRGRVFESRFLPKALLAFVVEDALAPAVVSAVADAARSDNESGDGLVWTSRVGNVTHHRTGKRLEEVEKR